MATEYERKRLENIKRNDEMMAALKVQAKASLLSATTKRPRENKSNKSFQKKSKSEETIDNRRQSLRKRGLNPDSGSLPDYFPDHPNRTSKTPLPHIASLPPSPKSSSPTPLTFDVAYNGDCSYTKFADSVLVIEKKSCSGDLVSGDDESLRVPRSVKKEVKPEKIEFDLGSLSLESCNVARVVPGRILVIKFLPSENVKMIVAGDKYGNIGFWNLDFKNDDDDGIYLFRPHTASVSSLVYQQNSFSRVISSSYDGLIRLMDVEKQVFDLVCSTDEAIFSLSQRPNDEQSLYFGEGNGRFHIYDLRAGKSIFHWDLHEDRINTIDFNLQNHHVMATSSTDGTACLWDLRSMEAKKPKTLTTLNHSRPVHSAYFSPSGLSLATTSFDNYIGILTGANFEDTSMIYHNNSTNRWISNFRGVWGWDDSYIFVGSMSKGIDVISSKLKRTVMELHSPFMTTFPCRIYCHPLSIGMLAGSSADGQVYVWSTK